MAQKTQLQKHIDQLVDKHKGVRTAARALGLDHALLYKLQKGIRKSASPESLRKLGLQRVEEIKLL
jgi:hypothetical protein